MRLRAQYLTAFVTVTLLIVVTVAVALQIVFRHQADEMRRAGVTAMATNGFEITSSHAQDTARILAESLVNPVYQTDIRAIANIVLAHVERPGIADVIVYDSARRILHDGTKVNAGYGFPARFGLAAGQDVAALLDAQPDIKMHLGDDRLSVVDGIRVGGDVIGWVAVSFPLASVQRDVIELEAEFRRLNKDAARETAVNAIAVTAVVGAFAVVLAIWGARRMTRPIAALIELSQNIGEGHYDATANVRRSDEIGQLARALTETAQKLKQETFSKAHLDSVLNSMFDGLVVTDDQARIQTMNRSAARLFGYDARELAGHKLSRVLVLPAVLTGRSGEGSGEGKVLTEGGRGLPVLVSRAAIGAADDPESGLVYVVRDISERIAQEKELREAKERAEGASKVKSEFLANMSHELRTPLNAILGFSEILQGEMFGPMGTPAYVGYAKDIHRSGQHLLSLINDILDLSKIEAGKQELHEENVDLTALLRETADLVIPNANREGVDFRVEVPDNLPNLWADRRALTQIVLNLLSNAIKFTPSGGSVRLGCAVRGERGLAISVADTGIGMDKDDLKVALEPFGQVENVYSRKHQGSGLGLPIIKALIELHGGTLDIDSEAGRGTTAVAVFPARRVKPRQGQAAAAAAPAAG
jgi:PAS domain S-box-containing protein